jgi:integrase
MASVLFKKYTKKNGKTGWQYQVQYKDGLTGKRRSTSRQGFATKSEAKLASEQFLQGLKTKSSSSLSASATKTTVKDLFDIWWPSYVITVEKSTAAKSLNIFQNHILNKLGDVRLSALTSPLVQQWVNDQMLNYVNYRKYTSYLKRLLKYAITMDLMQSNPFDKVSTPRMHGSRNTKTKAWDSDQFVKFIYTLKTKYRDENELGFTYLWLVAFTGMRRGEALALTWDDIDWNSAILRVDKALKRTSSEEYIGEPKTTSGERYLKLDNETLEVLATWQGHQYPKHRFIFSKVKEDFPINLTKPYTWFTQVEKMADLPHVDGLHTLRHTFATLAIENGFTPTQVQHQLGHRTSQITMDIYTHITKKASEDIGADFSSKIF